MTTSASSSASGKTIFSTNYSSASGATSAASSCQLGALGARHGGSAIAFPGPPRGVQNTQLLSHAAPNAAGRLIPCTPGRNVVNLLGSVPRCATSLLPAFTNHQDYGPIPCPLWGPRPQQGRTPRRGGPSAGRGFCWSSRSVAVSLVFLLSAESRSRTRRVSPRRSKGRAGRTLHRGTATSTLFIAWSGGGLPSISYIAMRAYEPRARRGLRARRAEGVVRRHLRWRGASEPTERGDKAGNWTDPFPSK